MQRGFQLFETTVAISLLLTVAGWSALSTQRLLAEHRLNAACLAIVSVAAAARAIAITRNTDMQLATRSLAGEFGLTPRHKEPAVGSFVCQCSGPLCHLPRPGNCGTGRHSQDHQ